MAMLSAAMAASRALPLSSMPFPSSYHANSAAASSTAPSLHLAPFLPSSDSFLSRRLRRSSPLQRSIFYGPNRLLCRASDPEYKFPDPIPEFAESETNKFRTHMLQRLTKKNEYFGDSVVEIVDVCTEIFNNFLHAEYGGPGTLLVIPFIDMADTLRERALPGAPQAARAAVIWAQKHVDKDWKEWKQGEDTESD